MVRGKKSGAPSVLIRASLRRSRDRSKFLQEAAALVEARRSADQTDECRGKATPGAREAPVQATPWALPRGYPKRGIGRPRKRTEDMTFIRGPKMGCRSKSLTSRRPAVPSPAATWVSALGGACLFSSLEP